MKRITGILIVFFLSLAASCSKAYEENYDSLFRTDAEGRQVPRMFTSYDLTSATGKLPVTVYYSGNWNLHFAEESSWAYLDRTEGKGVITIHVVYLQNDSGLGRSLTLKLECDNGESLDIGINQVSI